MSNRISPLLSEGAGGQDGFEAEGAAEREATSKEGLDRRSMRLTASLASRSCLRSPLSALCATQASPLVRSASITN